MTEQEECDRLLAMAIGKFRRVLIIGLKTDGTCTSYSVCADEDAPGMALAVIEAIHDGDWNDDMREFGAVQ